MRLVSIDVFRGIAILIMIFANSWPYIFPYNYCPQWLRLIFSTAAPIFIFLNGASVRISQEFGKTSISTIKRSLQILFIAMFIDTFIWKIYPFYTIDVLYLLSIATFILSFYKYIPLNFQLSIFILFFSSIFFINKFYSFELSEIEISQPIKEYSIKTSLHHLFFDGWFPLLPWLGISILGYISYELRYLYQKFSKYLLVIGLIIVFMFLLFSVIGNQFKQPLRNGYTEIFYPVTPIFFIYMLGLFCIISYFFNFDLFKITFLSKIGKVSLSIYLFHVLIIKYYIPLFSISSEEFSWKKFFIVIISFYVIIFGIAIILNKYINFLKHGKLKLLGTIIGI